MEVEDSEEEEVIVYANFEKGTIEKDVFSVPDLHWKIIGLESETPILQLGETTFKGEWKDTIGTKLLFEEDPSPEQVDPAFTVIPSTMLKYMGQTSKTLDFTRIFLKPKGSAVKTPDVENIDIINENNENNADGDSIENNIMDLAESTMNPTNETDSIMESIVNETITDM